MDDVDDVLTLTFGNSGQVGVERITDNGFHAITFEHDHIGGIENRPQLNRRSVGDIRETAGRLGAWGDIFKHHHEIHQTNQLRLLNVDRCHNTVNPDSLVFYPGFVGGIDQLHRQGSTFVLIPRQPIGAPEQSNHVGIVLIAQRQHGFIALGTGHNRIDDVRLRSRLQNFEPFLDSSDVGGIQQQRHIWHHFLYCLAYPRHQFVTVSLGRS